MRKDKKYLVKIYEQDGTTIIKTLSTEKPADGSMHVKNVPSFRTTINGGQGELVLDLEAPFDSFSEGTVVKHMNVVRVYAVVVDGVAISQATTLIYTGFMSQYEAYLEADG